MNLKLLTSAVLLTASFGLIACDDSSSPTSPAVNVPKETNQGTGNQETGFEQDPQNEADELPTCDVTTTSNSVTTVQSLPGVGAYKSTVTSNGSRYVSIKSEYTYYDLATAAEECEDMKEDASHWLDGSMQVSCSGNRIYVNEVDEGSLQNHEADFRENCEEFMERFGGGSVSTSTTPVSSGEFQCEVSRTATSVKIVQSYKGYYFEESATPNQAGYVVGVRKISFTDAEEAAEECADEKEDAKYSNDDLYTVECNGKNIVITKKIENLDLNTYEDYYEDWCQDQKRRLKNGELDLYL